MSEAFNLIAIMQATAGNEAALHRAIQKCVPPSRAEPVVSNTSPTPTPQRQAALSLSNAGPTKPPSTFTRIPPLP